MKKILVAAIFLFSQLGYTAGKAKQTDIINAKGYHIENETFSGLILTKDEMMSLNSKDRTVYLAGLMALAQIIEADQADVMGYADTNPRGKKTSSVQSGKVNLFFGTIPQARAVFPVAALLWEAGVLIAGTAAWQAGKGAVKYVMEKFASRTLASMAEKAAVKTATALETGVAKTAAVATFKLGSKEAITAAKEAVSLNIKNYKAAKEALAAAEKAFKPKAEITKLKEVEQVAQLNLTDANQAFIKNAKDPIAAEKELKKMYEGSKVWNFVKDNWLSVLGGAFVMEKGEVIFKEATGVTLNPAQAAIEEEQSNANAAANKAKAAQGLVGAPTKAEIAKPTKGKNCVFGGHPSVWVDFGAEGVKCTRPADSVSDACSGESDFSCNSYGFTISGTDSPVAVCEPLMPRDTLTVRCSESFKTTVSKAKGVVDGDKIEEFKKHLKEVIGRIESLDGMKDDEGKTKSIAAYCDKNEAQKPECEAIQGVLASLKETAVPQVLAARAPDAAANAPADGKAPAAGDVQKAN